MLVSETGRACEQQTVVMKSYKPLRHIRSFIINFIHFSIEIVFSDASHSVTLFESGLILLQFRPFTAWMSQVFHMVVSSNRKGQNVEPKQEQFQQNGLDKFTSTALYESNHGLQACREEYWPELFKQHPNIQKLHPEDYPLRDLKTYESSDFLTNYTQTH